MKTTVLTINQTKEEKKVEIPIDGKSKTNEEFLWERFIQREKASSNQSIHVPYFVIFPFVELERTKNHFK
jgi:hypothetical protein